MEFEDVGEVRIDREGDATVRVVLTQVIDFTMQERIRQIRGLVCSEEADELIVDMCGIRDTDVSGMTCALGLARDWQETGRAVSVVLAEKSYAAHVARRIVDAGGLGIPLEFVSD